MAIALGACGGSSAQTGPIAEPTVSDEQVDRFLERYFAGQEQLTTDDPTVVFVAESEATCKPLPRDRPDRFEVSAGFFSFWQVGPEPYYGISANVCHFEWSLLHMERPPAYCALLDERSLDELYAHLRALRVTEIETKQLDPIPHDRGGYWLTLRWPGGRCELSDVGGSEVTEPWGPAFTAAFDAFQDAFNTAIQNGNASPQSPHVDW